MAQANLKAVITAEDRASSVIGGVGNSFGKLTGAFFAAQLAATAVSKAMGAISDSVAGAISRVDTMNNFPKVMENLGISTEKSKKAMNALDMGLRGLPTKINDAALGVQRFTSASGDINKSTELFLSLNNAILAGGAPMQNQQAALEQFTQAFSKGKFELIEWRSLQQTMPAQLKQIAKSMGYVSDSKLYDALQSGKVTMSAFTDQIIRLNKKGTGNFASFEKQAKGATSGIQTGIANARTAIERGVGKIIQSLGAANIAGAVTAIGKAFEAFLVSITKVVSFIKANQLAFQMLGAALLGAATAIMISLIPAFIAWTVAASAAAVATIAATWPILAIGAAIGVVAFLVIKHWATIKNAFSVALTFIYTKLVWLKDNFWTVIGRMIGFFALLPIKFPFYVAIAFAKIVSYVLSFKWSSIFAGIWQAMQGVWDKITNMAVKAWQYIHNLKWGDIMKGVAKGIGNAIVGLIEGAINGAISGIPGVKDVRLPRFAQGVRDFGGGSAIVGENGAERVILPKGSSVMPHSRSGGGGNINITVQAGAYMGNKQDARQYAQMIFDSLKDVAQSNGMTMAQMVGK